MDRGLAIARRAARAALGRGATDVGAAAGASAPAGATEDAPLSALPEPPAEPRWTRPALLLLVLYALALLTIGITEDWRLLHEDNGAFHTTLARAHLDLGLARTRAHDLFFSPRTGEGNFYGHHPPAPSLVLAAAFAATGSDAPWVARSVAIAFHLASLLLLVALLRLHFAPGLVVVGGVLFATLPMSAYFGRMPNYEPLCLTGVLLQLLGWARWRALGERRGLALLVAGIAWAGFVDWPGFFFAAALGAVELLNALRGERRAWRRFGVLAGVAGGVLAFDLVHLLVASGSLERLTAVVTAERAAAAPTLGTWLDKMIHHARGYFGRAALAAALLAAVALATGRTPVARALRETRHAPTLARWLGASGLAALAYTVAAPSWAIVHAYWQFYFLPFVVTALVLLVAAALRGLDADTRRARLWAAVLLAVAIDVGNTSVRMLVKRHTRVEDYAVRQTEQFRADFLPPRSLPGSGHR